MPDPTKAAGFLDLIAACNTFSDHQAATGELYRLYLPRDNRPHGLLLPDIVKKVPWPNNFQVTHDARRVDVLDESAGQNTSTAVSAAFAQVVEATMKADLFSILRDHDDEYLSLVGTDYPVRLYRYAQPLFGIIGQGSHLTAYTHTPEGLKIWVPRRSATIDVSPSMLDSTAAGGVRAGLSPFEAIIEEAEEEGSLPADLIHRDARASGALTYVTLLGMGQQDEHELIVPHVVYVYDIELAADVIPKLHDNEVEGFYLMGVEEVKKRLLNCEFKHNCALVMIDFFMRHGIITPETDRDYIEISARLHRPLPFNTAIV